MSSLVMCLLGSGEYACSEYLLWGCAGILWSHSHSYNLISLASMYVYFGTITAY